MMTTSLLRRPRPSSCIPGYFNTKLYSHRYVYVKAWTTMPTRDITQPVVVIWHELAAGRVAPSRAAWHVVRRPTAPEEKAVIWSSYEGLFALIQLEYSRGTTPMQAYAFLGW